MAGPRIAKVYGAVNLGSFRISAMIAGLTETGESILMLGLQYFGALDWLERLIVP